MSNKYNDALNYVSGYYQYKMSSESNKVRPMWFTGFVRYGTEPTGLPTAPADMPGLLDLFDPSYDDTKAFNLYTQAKGDSPPEGRDMHAAQVRTRVMASLRQTVRRQWFGADGNVHTGADLHRYEYDRKVAAAGLANFVRDQFKETT